MGARTGRRVEPNVKRWLSQLQWLPRDDSAPEVHRQISFLELVLDFESHAGRPLPPTLQTTFVGAEMSPQEKRPVIRLGTSLPGGGAGQESILPVDVTNKCRSLVPLGLGTTAGATGRPIFTRLTAVWHHLRRPQQQSSVGLQTAQAEQIAGDTGSAVRRAATTEGKRCETIRRSVRQ